MKQDLKPIIEKARLWAINESQKNGTPALLHIELSNKVGQRLAAKLKADKDIVMLGTLLMDVKLGECFKEGKIEEHIARSANATKTFLEQNGVDKKIITNVVSCVENHHGAKKFYSKESEICANADCYRFLDPKGIFAAFDLISRRFNDFEKTIKQMEYKMDEKHGIVSLSICKKELEPNYKYFKKAFANMKKE